MNRSSARLRSWTGKPWDWAASAESSRSGRRFPSSGASTVAHVTPSSSLETSTQRSTENQFLQAPASWSFSGWITAHGMLMRTAGLGNVEAETDMHALDRAHGFLVNRVNDLDAVQAVHQADFAQPACGSPAHRIPPAATRRAGLFPSPRFLRGRCVARRSHFRREDKYIRSIRGWPRR